MTKPIDADIKGLKMADKGMRLTSERMRAATLLFLWDKYVLQPQRDAAEALATAVVKDKIGGVK